MEKDINWEEMMKDVAKKLTGFSGREISKLAIAWQVGENPLHCMLYMFGLNRNANVL